jgi:SAM-dependent methyltransferase
MSLQALRQIVAPLTNSALALGALGAALDARTSGVPLDPRVRAHVDGVLDALGAREVVASLSPAELAPVLAMTRAMLTQAANLTSPTRRAVSWSSTDPEFLQAVGVGSVGHVHALKGMVLPSLAGAAERLEVEGGAFLDLGTGVGMVAIEVVRLWPKARVVGLDVWAPSLALARENVRRAGLGERIELREQGGQDLPDEAAFDIAWVAQPFIPGELMGRILERVHRALRPGGWVVTGTANTSSPDPLSASIGRLLTGTWGGGVVSNVEVEAMLTGAGFAEVRTMPAPPTAPAVFIVGRRA